MELFCNSGTPVCPIIIKTDKEKESFFLRPDLILLLRIFKK
jgi:hypothetical protein